MSSEPRHQKSRLWRTLAVGLPSLLLLSGCSKVSGLGFDEGVSSVNDISLPLWQGAWIAAGVVGIFTAGLILWPAIFHRKKNDEPILAFARTTEWHAWLKANHRRSGGVLLRIAKGATKAVSYAEALDAALTWGWIDSRKQALDADAWLQRFTPRTAKSPWSKINRAKAENDRMTLGRTVQISERFLQTHFGYSVAHLNLAIAKISLDDPKSALPPAFHSIVFNPDGANGYVALAVALARIGDVASSTAAFCSVLRKVKYSDKTVTFFARIARGEDFPYTEVTQAMRDTENMCPKEKWGTDYPTS